MIDVFSIQILLFAVTLSGFWLTEKLLLPGCSKAKWRHASDNAFLTSFTLPVQLSCGFSLAILASWVETHQWGLVYFLPHNSSPWIKYGLMFLVLDLLDYIYHNCMHKVPGFWRFHLVHHTDQCLDVSTTLREHPCETLLRNGFLMCWVLLCGASASVLILRQTAQTLSNITSHTSFRLPQRLAKGLGWVLVTPNFHHVHHHFKLPYTDCNYGDSFSIWDRLFGTFAELPAQDTAFGLDTHMIAFPAGPLAIVTMPFRRP